GPGGLPAPRARRRALRPAEGHPLDAARHAAPAAAHLAPGLAGVTRAPRRVPLARPSFGPEEEALLLETLRSGWVTQGPRVEELERSFAEAVGAAHAVAVSNATTALFLALHAQGIGPGDEVVTPSLTFIASANAIVHAGATPVLVDV